MSSLYVIYSTNKQGKSSSMSSNPEVQDSKFENCMESGNESDFDDDDDNFEDGVNDEAGKDDEDGSSSSESEDDGEEEINDEASSSEEEGETSHVDESKTEQNLCQASCSNVGSDSEEACCYICMNKFIGQELGSPSCCSHTFCLDCIFEWSKKVNTCPLDRKEFTSIHLKFSPDGPILKEITVTVLPRQPEDPLPEDTTVCEVCHQGNNEDRLLLCDACDLAYHCECLTPPLRHVPIEQWFCPPCLTIFKPKSNRTAQHRRTIARTLVSETVRSRIQNLRTSLQENRSASSSTNRASTGKPRTVLRRKATRRRRRRTAVVKPLARTKGSRGSEKGGKGRAYTTVYRTTRRRRRRTKRRKTAIRSSKTKRSRLAAVPLAAPSTKRRIADRLGLCKPPSGMTTPYVKKSIPGAPSTAQNTGSYLRLFGNKDQLMDFEEDFTQSQTSSSSSSRISKPLFLPRVDILGGIMAAQDILHTSSKNITIGTDGSLNLNSSELEDAFKALRQESIQKPKPNVTPSVVKKENTVVKIVKTSSKTTVSVPSTSSHVKIKTEMSTMLEKKLPKPNLVSGRVRLENSSSKVNTISKNSSKQNSSWLPKAKIKMEKPEESLNVDKRQNITSLNDNSASSNADHVFSSRAGVPQQDEFSVVKQEAMDCARIENENSSLTKPDLNFLRNKRLLYLEKLSQQCKGLDSGVSTVVESPDVRISMVTGKPDVGIQSIDLLENSVNPDCVTFCGNDGLSDVNLDPLDSKVKIEEKPKVEPLSDDYVLVWNVNLPENDVPEPLSIRNSPFASHSKRRDSGEIQNPAPKRTRTDIPSSWNIKGQNNTSTIGNSPTSSEGSSTEGNPRNGGASKKAECDSNNPKRADQKEDYDLRRQNSICSSKDDTGLDDNLLRNIKTEINANEHLLSTMVVQRLSTEVDAPNFSCVDPNIADGSQLPGSYASKRVIKPERMSPGSSAICSRTVPFNMINTETLLSSQTDDQSNSSDTENLRVSGVLATLSTESISRKVNSDEKRVDSSEDELLNRHHKKNNPVKSKLLTPSFAECGSDELDTSRHETSANDCLLESMTVVLPLPHPIPSLSNYRIPKKSCQSSLELSQIPLDSNIPLKKMKLASTSPVPSSHQQGRQSSISSINVLQMTNAELPQRKDVQRKVKHEKLSSKHCTQQQAHSNISPSTQPCTDVLPRKIKQERVSPGLHSQCIVGYPNASNLGSSFSEVSQFSNGLKVKIKQERLSPVSHSHCIGQSFDSGNSSTQFIEPSNNWFKVKVKQERVSPLYSNVQYHQSYSCDTFSDSNSSQLDQSNSPYSHMKCHPPNDKLFGDSRTHDKRKKEGEVQFKYPMNSNTIDVKNEHANACPKTKGLKRSGCQHGEALDSLSLKCEIMKEHEKSKLKEVHKQSQKNPSDEKFQNNGKVTHKVHKGKDAQVACIEFIIKSVLKPFFKKNEISKDDFKEIMRRCVHKILSSSTTEIKPKKIEDLVLKYVVMFRKRNKEYD